MNIDQVIAQIRLLSPVFVGNVAGAAAYAYGVQDQVWLPRPAAYVVPDSEEAEANESMTGLWQIVAERINVIVDLDNSSDRRGQASALRLNEIRGQIFKAILNWRPDWNPANPATNVETRGFRYGGAEILLMDRARVHYQYQFILDTTITDLDGWQLPFDPLVEIQGRITDPASGIPTATSFDVLPDQT